MVWGLVGVIGVVWGLLGVIRVMWGLLGGNWGGVGIIGGLLGWCGDYWGAIGVVWEFMIVRKSKGKIMIIVSVNFFMKRVNYFLRFSVLGYK